MYIMGEEMSDIFDFILLNPLDIDTAVQSRLEIFTQLSDALPKYVDRYIRGVRRPLTELQKVRDTRVKYISVVVDLLSRYRMFNPIYLAKLLTRVDWIDGLEHIGRVFEEDHIVNDVNKLSALSRLPMHSSVNYSSALFSPLAWHIFVAFRSPFVQNIITVEGLAGTGKTTFVYNSLKAVLLNIGFSQRDIYEIFTASYIQRSEELATLLVESSRKGVRIPIIIFDDVALTAHAYEWWTRRRDWLTKLSKALTISRENIDCIVFIGPQKKIFSGLRGISHLTFSALSKKEVVADKPYIRTVTLWTVKMELSTVDWTGTAVPPLFVDNEVYRKISAVKQMLWREAVEELEKIGEEEKEKEYGEEAEMDEEEVES